MKIIKKGFFLTLFLLLTACVQSQSNNKDVATVVDKLYAAMVDKDKTVLENLTLEYLSYGHSSGTIENKSEYLDAVINGPFDFISITPSDQTIRSTDDTAIVRHIFAAKANNAGEPAEVRIGAMLVFQKQGGAWKLLARQAFKL